MNKNLAILLSVLIIGAAAFGYLVYKSGQDNPKAPPTYGYTKIVNAQIYRAFTLNGTPMKGNTKIMMTIDVSNKEELRTVEVELYSRETPIAKATIITTINGTNGVITKTYSDTTTSFVMTTAIPYYGKFDTNIGVTLISSNGTKTYYGTFVNDPITYTFVYGGHNTWYGEYTGTTTISGMTLTIDYRATIIQ